MRWRLALCSLALVAAACGDDDAAGDAGPGDAGEAAPLAVVTWNVENFFDAIDDPDTEDDVPTGAQVSRKVEELARVLRAADADVIVLQEVENEAVLDRLANAIDYPHRGLMPGNDPRGINLAWIARVEPTMVAHHIDDRFPAPDGSREFRFARDAVEVFLEVGGAEIAIMILHLRSQREGGDDHRLAEATQAHSVVRRRGELGTPRMLVMGDLNDEPGSPAIDALTSDGLLVDLAAELPVDERWTFTGFGDRKQFDYVLATEGMREWLVPGSVRVLRGAEVETASDHFPVVARFQP